MSADALKVVIKKAGYSPAFFVHAELEDEDEILERAAMMAQEALNKEIRKKPEI